MLATIIRFELCGFLIALIAVVGWQLLVGRIATRGLLTTGKTGIDSPARMQMLLLSLGGAAWYFGQVLHSPDNMPLPEVPDQLIAVLGGSHVTYLGAKAIDQLGWLGRLFDLNSD